MAFIDVLPDEFKTQFLKWRSVEFPKKKLLFESLFQNGQQPKAMIISCCDSRVLGKELFQADIGALFVYRNIANLVPPYCIDSQQDGVSAAIEYAVEILKIPRIIVLGHSYCGGVEKYYQIRDTDMSHKADNNIFIDSWVNNLESAYDRVVAHSTDMQRNDRMNFIKRLEQEGVIVSLENIMTFPFVSRAVQSGMISLHGLWHDIVSGDLYQLDTEQRKFVNVY